MSSRDHSIRSTKKTTCEPYVIGGPVLFHQLGNIAIVLMLERSVRIEHRLSRCLLGAKPSSVINPLLNARGDLLPNRAFTRTDALLDEAALHGVARQVERLVEMLARDLGSPAVKFELAERRMIERIGGKAIAVGDSMNLFEAAFGAFMLGDSNCP